MGEEDIQCKLWLMFQCNKQLEIPQLRSTAKTCRFRVTCLKLCISRYTACSLCLWRCCPGFSHSLSRCCYSLRLDCSSPGYCAGALPGQSSTPGSPEKAVPIG